jgi:hypothetical protein
MRELLEACGLCFNMIGNRFSRGRNPSAALGAYRLPIHVALVPESTVETLNGKRKTCNSPRRCSPPSTAAASFHDRGPPDPLARAYARAAELPIRTTLPDRRTAVCYANFFARCIAILFLHDFNFRKWEDDLTSRG